MSEGGLAVGLTECLFGSLGERVGASVEFDTDLPAAAALFAESQGRFLVSLREEKRDAFEEMADDNNVPWQRIGTTGGDSLSVCINGEEAVNFPVDALRDAWWNALEQELEA